MRQLLASEVCWVDEKSYGSVLVNYCSNIHFRSIILKLNEYRYCPECINKDADVVVGKGKAVAQPSKPAVIVRDMDCVLGNLTLNDVYHK